MIFWLYLYFLDIIYSFKYSCPNILHKRSPCTFYKGMSVVLSHTQPQIEAVKFENGNGQFAHGLRGVVSI